MKILITSGGTSEAIDRVRSITNHSTGQLGKYLVQECLKQGVEVTLVTTKNAVKPAPHQRLTCHLVENVASLQETLEPLVKSHDVLIHSMAVSDYTPVYMTSLAEAQEVPHLSDLLNKSNTEPKLSSKEDYQVLLLKKTPKIISLVKQWNPTIRLIGFKLLVAEETEKLLEVARESLVKNQADYILANDLTAISNTRHTAYLVGADGYDTAHTKEEIAQLIVRKIIERRN